MATRHRLSTTAAAVVLLAAVTGCSRAHVDTNDLDAYHESNVSFFTPVTYGGALEPEHYKTMEEAVRSASAVVIAEVTAVRRGDTVIGEVPTDITEHVAIDIRPVEVLKGKLADQVPDTLTLQRLAIADIDKAISDMKADLPPGPSVWFLRDKADYANRVLNKEYPKNDPAKLYRLISSQGLWVQGQDSIIDPLVDTDYGMADQATRTYSRMSDFVDYIRGVDGWTGNVPPDM